MRVAIPTWNGAISPVFDVARRLLVVDIEGGSEVSRNETMLEDTQFASRVNRVSDIGVNVLICGAISRPLEAMLASSGVRVIAQTCGSTEDVLRAFASGQLTDTAFVMPGCCGRRRRFRGHRHNGWRNADSKGDAL
jgi:predicted Fe-Mo cluster-binding NifX family protein